MTVSALSPSSITKLLLITLAAVVLSTTASARSVSEYKFSGPPDGANPYSGLASDGAGNFYGVTWDGGLPNCADFFTYCGTVFMASLSQNGVWKEETIYEFTGGADGGFPEGTLAIDGAGNLYGTASGAGQAPLGTVFKLTPNQGGSWTESNIYTFQAPQDGREPESGVIFDPAGNLYGTTQQDGPAGNGTVFELTPGQNGSWILTTLYSFLGGTDGVGPSGLTLDAAGNLYGTTLHGGNVEQGQCACGTVFELSPSQNGSWAKTILYSFDNGPDGGEPQSPPTFDKKGNLFGTASTGGSTACSSSGCGVLYRLSPSGDGSWQFSLVHAFNGSKGEQPLGSLSFDSGGSLYGTTGNGGGNLCCGTIFKVTPSGAGHATFNVLGVFDGADGAGPGRGVLVDGHGNIYGTTTEGGEYNCQIYAGCGTIFKLAP